MWKEGLLHNTAFLYNDTACRDYGSARSLRQRITLPGNGNVHAGKCRELDGTRSTSRSGKTGTL